MKHVIRRATVIALVVIATIAPAAPASADNCGSLTDCFDTLTGALAIVAAVAILLALVTMFPPGGDLVLAGSGLIVGGSVAIPASVTTGLIATGAIATAGAVVLHMASSPGGGGDNRRQNRQFKEAVRRIERELGRKLSRNDIQRLHREISKQGLTLEEIVEWGLSLLGG